jgi:hypothetical protein
MNLRLIDRGTTSLRGASQQGGIVSGEATESRQANVIHDAARLGDARILQSTFDAARRVSRYWTERAIRAPQQEEASV